MTREERDRWFDIVGDSCEYDIERETSKGVMQSIMNWWYRMCDERRDERGG